MLYQERPVRVVNLRLFDVDHCLFHQYDNSKNITEWLISTNLALFDAIAADIEQYDKVIVAIGSNRQDYITDAWNDGGSCCPILPVIQSYLQARTKRPVYIDPFLMSDLYKKNKPAGSSYQAILKERLCYYDLQRTKFKLSKADLNLFHQDTDAKVRPLLMEMAIWHNVSGEGECLLKHDRACIDVNKISLIYAHAHRTALLHPSAEHIFIDFVDDNLPILAAIHGFFKNAPDFLPNQVTLRLHQYPIVQRSFAALTGRGLTDALYTWMMRYFANNRNLANNMTAAELLDCHERRNYDVSITSDEEFCVYFTAEKHIIARARAFRDNELPKLSSTDIAVTQQANYTNAWKLYHDGLIPGEFVLSHDVQPDLLPATEIAHIKPIKAILSRLFYGHINQFYNRIFRHDTSKAEEIHDALMQCRDLTDMKLIIRLSRSAKDNENMQLLIARGMHAIQEFEQSLLRDGSLQQDSLINWEPLPATSSSAYCLRILDAKQLLVPDDLSMAGPSQRVMMDETSDSLLPQSHYSHEYYLILRADKHWQRSPAEEEWYRAFSRKWLQQKMDMNFSRLHILNLSSSDDIENVYEYKKLEHLDSHSRITIIGEHESGTDYFTCRSKPRPFTSLVDYFTCKVTKVHYTQIIDLICHYAQSPDILLNKDTLNQNGRALRINFISSNIHEPRRLEESLARKMFLYALNHPTKPLRIELSAPQLHCAAFLGNKEAVLTEESNQMFSRFKWMPIYHYHKRYSEKPFDTIFVNEKVPHLPAHSKPPHRKVLFQIDAANSVPGNIVVQEIEDAAWAPKQ